MSTGHKFFYFIKNGILSDNKSLNLPIIFSSVVLTHLVGMVHSVVLLLVLLFLMPYAGLIPMPTIAAILFMVAYNMSEWKKFVGIIKTETKSDILILVVTFVLTVIFDLIVAIAVGMVLAAIVFIVRKYTKTNRI